MFFDQQIQSLVKKDFFLLNSGDENFQSTLNEVYKKESYKKIFIRNYSEIYEVDQYNSYNRAKNLYTISIDEIGQLINTHFTKDQSYHNPIIVLDDNGKMMGYIELGNLFQYLASHIKKIEAILKTILDTIDVSCTVIDKNRKVLVWTKEAERIFSIKREDILGEDITNFFHYKDLEIISALEKGTSSYQKQHYAKENLIVLINSNPIRLDNHIIGAVVSETDITRQVHLSQQFFDISEKAINLEKKVKEFSEEKNPFSKIKGSSMAIKETFSKIKKASTTPANILITGESGVGKELFAEAVHNLRENKNAPYIPINCGAIPGALFESELFGYEKGAFSGADHRGKKGKIELANQGTLFLDEIGEMPMDMQVKLLRVLQEKKFFRVGGTKEIEVDFNLIAATNQDLEKLIQEGKFREDLYYRLNVINIHIPPLRERSPDIIELVQHFLHEFSIKYNRPIHSISQEILQVLLNYDWPGNVRELKNTIERLVVFSDEGELNIEDIPFYQIGSRKRKSSTKKQPKSLKEQLNFYEKEIIIQELKNTKGNKKLCAKNLGISRATLYNRIKKLNIDDQNI